MTISKKQKTKRATGLDRRTKEETAKENQMTAPEIPDRSGTSDIPGLPLGRNKLYMDRVIITVNSSVLPSLK